MLQGFQQLSGLQQLLPLVASAVAQIGGVVGDVREPAAHDLGALERVAGGVQEPLDDAGCPRLDGLVVPSPAHRIEPHGRAERPARASAQADAARESGHHHRMHEDRFFELGGSLIVEVEFIVTPDEKERLLEVIAAEKIRLFYAEIPATFGVLNPDSDDAVPGAVIPRDES